MSVIEDGNGAVNKAFKVAEGQVDAAGAQPVREPHIEVRNSRGEIIGRARTMAEAAEMREDNA